MITMIFILVFTILVTGYYKGFSEMVKFLGSAIVSLIQKLQGV